MEFILGVFAKFCRVDGRQIHGYHLVLTLQDESLIQHANDTISQARLTDRVTLLSNLNPTDRLQLLKQSQMLFYPF